MSYFPMLINIDKNDEVLIVGGGNTAFHKLRVLLGFECRIHITADVYKPCFTDIYSELDNLHDGDIYTPITGKDKLIQHIKNKYNYEHISAEITYEKNDIKKTDIFNDNNSIYNKYKFIVAATDDDEVNKAIYDRGHIYHIPVNVVDDPKLCDFIFPSMIKKGDLVCAVSSGGVCPPVTQYIRDEIEDMLPEDIDNIITELGALRDRLKDEVADHGERSKLLKEAYIKRCGYEDKDRNKSK